MAFSYQWTVVTSVEKISVSGPRIRQFRYRDTIHRSHDGLATIVHINLSGLLVPVLVSSIVLGFDVDIGFVRHTRIIGLVLLIVNRPKPKLTMTRHIEAVDTETLGSHRKSASLVRKRMRPFVKHCNAKSKLSVPKPDLMYDMES